MERSVGRPPALARRADPDGEHAALRGDAPPPAGAGRRAVPVRPGGAEAPAAADPGAAGAAPGPRGPAAALVERFDIEPFSDFPAK